MRISYIIPKLDAQINHKCTVTQSKFHFQFSISSPVLLKYKILIDSSFKPKILSICILKKDRIKF